MSLLWPTKLSSNRDRTSLLGKQIFNKAISKLLKLTRKYEWCLINVEVFLVVDRNFRIAVLVVIIVVIQL